MRLTVRIALAATAAALAFGCASATAATISVQTDVDSGSFDDTGCGLREAIQAANDNAPFHECNGDAAGADVILLQGGHTYQLSNRGFTDGIAIDDDNTDGDLDITGGGGTTIRSVGAGLATIDGDSTAPPLAKRDRVIQVISGAGPVTLDHVRVTHGYQQVGSESGGGGIKADGDVTVIDSEVSDNFTGQSGSSSDSYGGGIFSTGGNLDVIRSTVSGNAGEDSIAGVASARGGGISFFGDTFTAVNSTISGNHVTNIGSVNASEGGGIYQGGGTMNLSSVTIAGNQAIDPAGDPVGSYGGGIYSFSDDGTVTGTILSGDTAAADPECFVDGTFSTLTANTSLIEDTTGCSLAGGAGNVNGNSANLGPLSNYGGPTRTRILNPGSPAINAGGGTCPATDQRGFFRAPVAPCDIGAFELNAPSSLPAAPVAAATAAGPTGQQAAALAKCKKKKGKKRKKCKKKALLLPL